MQDLEQKCVSDVEHVACLKRCGGNGYGLCLKDAENVVCLRDFGYGGISERCGAWGMCENCGTGVCVRYVEYGAYLRHFEQKCV